MKKSKVVEIELTKPEIDYITGFDYVKIGDKIYMARDRAIMMADELFKQTQLKEKLTAKLF